MRGKGKGGVVSGFWVREPWPLFLLPPPSYLHHIFQLLHTFCSQSIPCQLFPVLLPHLPNYTPTSLPLFPVFIVAWSCLQSLNFVLLCNLCDRLNRTTSQRHNCLHFLSGFASIISKTPAPLTEPQTIPISPFDFYFHAGHPLKLICKQHWRFHENQLTSNINGDFQ